MPTNPERELAKLEKRFIQEATSRRPSLVLKTLSSGRPLKVPPRQVSQESQDHARRTSKMLELIDRYAKIHYNAKGEVHLPSNMISELNRLARRETVTFHPDLNRALKRALETHRKRLGILFRKAEEIRDKHKIVIADALKRKLAA